MRESLASIMSAVPDAIEPRLVAYNTAHYTRPDGAEVWRLRQTDVVTKLPDGRFKLDSGGFRTSVTKDRIGRFSPARIAPGLYDVWYVGPIAEFAVAPFFDGIVVDGDGNAPIFPEHAVLRDPQKIALLRRQINQFCETLGFYGSVQQPDMSDCWACRAQVERPRGGMVLYCHGWVPSPLKPGTERWHLESHLSDVAANGTLLVNAMRWAGISEHQILAAFSGHDYDRIRRAVRRYLKHKLGLST